MGWDDDCGASVVGDDGAFEVDGDSVSVVVTDVAACDVVDSEVEEEGISEVVDEEASDVVAGTSVEEVATSVVGAGEYSNL